MDKDNEFMELVSQLMEQGFTQQEAIDEAKERLGMAYGGRIGLRQGTPEEGIGSLDAGAPDITYEGNEGPKSPAEEMKMASMMSDMAADFEIEHGYDMAVANPAFREAYIQEWLKKNFYDKYNIPFNKGGRAGYALGTGPVLPSDEDPINPFTPKPTGPVLPEKMEMASETDYVDMYSRYAQEIIQAGGTPMSIENFIAIIKEQERTKEAKGGRIGFQTGGTTVDQRFQPEYIEALGKTYAADLTRQAGIPAITQATQQMPGETASQFAQRQAQAQQFDITQQSMGLLAPQVAGQDALQQAAYTQATAPTYGLAAYQPYTADARAAAQAAGALTGPMTTAQRTAYMSPYQQDVIDATMTEFDAQAQRRENERAAAALGIPGAYGGGREGVQKAVYQTESDQNRAALLAQLRQTGFQQAQAGRQQDFANQQALATQQAGLGTQAMGNVQRQIAGLGTLGATQQAQNQAVLEAQRQFAGMAVNEPQQRLGMLGQGVTGLMGGMQGAGTTIGQAPPQTSPLGTALGIGSTLAGIYGYMNR